MGSHSNVSILSFHLPKVSESLVLGLCVNRPPRLPPHPEMWLPAGESKLPEVFPSTRTLLLADEFPGFLLPAPLERWR